jgi:hypothetical protein
MSGHGTNLGANKRKQSPRCLRSANIEEASLIATDIA